MDMDIFNITASEEVVEREYSRKAAISDCGALPPNACPDKTASIESTSGCDDSGSSWCGSGSKATGVIAFIIVLIVFAILWVGLFNSLTSPGRRDGHGGSGVCSGNVGGVLVALAIVFILLLILIWVIDSNPHWGVWLSGFFILLAIIFFIWIIVSTANAGKDGKDDHSKSG
jgi:hypothetical protein